MRLSWFIARRYLAPQRRGRFLSFITWIALSGVIVGVTALIVVIGVMTGMQEDLRGKILDANPHVMVHEFDGGGLALENWPAVVERIESVEGVVSATPFIFSKVMVVGRDYAQAADLWGFEVPEGSEDAGEAATPLERRMREGALDLSPPASGLPPILLGIRLAQRGGHLPPDTVEVTAFEGTSTRIDPLTLYPPTRRRLFEVTGTVTTGMYEYDNGYIYARLGDAQALLGLSGTDQVSGVAVQTEDAWEAGRIGRAIVDSLGFDYYVRDWMEQNRDLFAALRLEKLVMGLILFLIVVVAAFNIVGTLVMVVVDRTREIGILKSMGMTDGQVLRVFMLQGAWIGMIGTGIGTLAGLILAWVIDTFEIIRIPPEVYFVEKLPVSLHFFDVAMIVAASVAVAFLATVYPSLQASHLEPVEAIRHE